MAIKKLVEMAQGATFSQTWPLFRSASDEFSLTGYSARGSMRTHYESEVEYDLTCTIDTNAKTATVSMAASATEDVPAGHYVFDVEIYNSGGTVHRMFSGKIIVTPEATRS